MESDLSELDEWLGTLEQLQRGLLESCSNGIQNNDCYSISESSHSGSSFRSFENIPAAAVTSSYKPGRDESIPSTCQTSFCPSNIATIVRADHQSTATPPPPPPHNVSQGNAFHTTESNDDNTPTDIRTTPFPSSNGTITNEMRKDLAASKELDILLKELSIIEHQMYELENMEDTFMKRYSLASSTDKSSNPDIRACPPFINHLNDSREYWRVMNNISAQSLDSGIQESGISTHEPFELPHLTHNRKHSFDNQFNMPGKIKEPVFSPIQSGQQSSVNIQTQPQTQNLTSQRSTVNHNQTDGRRASSHTSVENLYRSIEDSAENKVVIRIYHPDRTTKAILVSETNTIREIRNILIEKNFCEPNLKLSLVEKVPCLKMEHTFEDHEILAECIHSWPTNAQSMIFFEEREDKYGLFLQPKNWLSQELIGEEHPIKFVKEIIFSGIEPHIPAYSDYLYIKKPGEKTWARKFCLVRNSGLYAYKKKKCTVPSDLMCIMVLDAAFHLYTTTGGWTKLKAPTPYGFAMKPYSAQDSRSKLIFYFCASDEMSLKRWITLIRIAKHGKQLMANYSFAVKDMEEMRQSKMNSVSLKEQNSMITNRSNQYSSARFNSPHLSSSNYQHHHSNAHRSTADRHLLYSPQANFGKSRLHTADSSSNSRDNSVTPFIHRKVSQ